MCIYIMIHTTIGYASRPCLSRSGSNKLFTIVMGCYNSNYRPGNFIIINLLSNTGCVFKYISN